MCELIINNQKVCIAYCGELQDEHTQVVPNTAKKTRRPRLSTQQAAPAAEEVKMQINPIFSGVREAMRNPKKMEQRKGDATRDQGRGRHRSGSYHNGGHKPEYKDREQRGLRTKKHDEHKQQQPRDEVKYALRMAHRDSVYG